MESKFRDRFAKDLDEILSQTVLDDIAKAISDVEKASKPQDIPNIKKIKGDKSAFRIRIGNFRIGIFVVKGVVEFTRVLPRDKIYKYFPK